MLDLIYLICIAPLEFCMRHILDWGFDLTKSYGLALIFMSLAVNTVILPIYNKVEGWQEEERALKARMAPMETMIRGKEEGYLQKHAYAGAKRHELAVAVLAVQRGYHGKALLPFEHLSYHGFHGGHAGFERTFLFLPAFHLVVDGQDDRVHGKAHQDEGKAIGRRSVKAPAQNDLHTEFKRGDADEVEKFQHGKALSTSPLPSFSFRKAGLGFYIPRGKRTYFSSGESG